MDTIIAGQILADRVRDLSRPPLFDLNPAVNDRDCKSLKSGQCIGLIVVVSVDRKLSRKGVGSG
jgi:hypothetical protein